MSCCDETTARVPPTDVSRRSILKGAAVITALVPAANRSEAQGRSIKLAYCSQLLCGVPYEVARAGGHFKNHGLNVELVYTRGGSAAMQALVGGAVDYGATSLDVAITAFGNAGADIRRFAVTGRLPLFAVITAPKTAATITTVKALEGKTVGISALGNGLLIGLGHMDIARPDAVLRASFPTKAFFGDFFIVFEGVLEDYGGVPHPGDGDAPLCGELDGL